MESSKNLNQILDKISKEVGIINEKNANDVNFNNFNRVDNDKDKIDSLQGAVAESCKYGLTAGEVKQIISLKDQPGRNEALKSNKSDIILNIQIGMFMPDPKNPQGSNIINDSFKSEDLENYLTLLKVVDPSNRMVKQIEDQLSKKNKEAEDQANNVAFSNKIKPILSNQGTTEEIKAQKQVIYEYLGLPQKGQTVDDYLKQVDIMKISEPQRALLCIDLAWTSGNYGIDMSTKVTSESSGKEYTYTDIHNKLKNGERMSSPDLPYDVFSKYQKTISDAKLIEANILHTQYFGNKIGNDLKLYNQTQGDGSNTTGYGEIVDYMREGLDYGENMVRSKRLLKFNDKGYNAELFLIPKGKDIHSDGTGGGTVELAVGEKRMIFSYNNNGFSTKDSIDGIAIEKSGSGYIMRIDRKLATTPISLITRSGRYADGSFDEWSLGIAGKNCELVASAEKNKTFSIKGGFKLNSSDLNEKVDGDIKNIVENVGYEIVKPGNENKIGQLDISVGATTTIYDINSREHFDKVDSLTSNIKKVMNGKVNYLTNKLLSKDKFISKNYPQGVTLRYNNNQYQEAKLNQYGSVEKWININDSKYDIAGKIDFIKSKQNEVVEQSKNRIDKEVLGLDPLIEKGLDARYNEGGDLFKYRDQHIALMKARYLNILFNMIQDPATAEDMLSGKIKINTEFTKDLTINVKYSMI